MTRPNSSVVGFIDLAMTTRNAGKIISVNKSLTSLSGDFNTATQSIIREIHSIKQAQLATIAGLVHVNDKLKHLHAVSNATLAELKRQDAEAENLGDLKLFLIDVEDAVEEIKSMSKNFPEYAALLAEDLCNLLDFHGVHHGQFKRMDQDGIRWAKSVIQQVKELEWNLKENWR